MQTTTVPNQSNSAHLLYVLRQSAWGLLSVALVGAVSAWLLSFIGWFPLLAATIPFMFLVNITLKAAQIRRKSIALALAILLVFAFLGASLSVLYLTVRSNIDDRAHQIVAAQALSKDEVDFPATVDRAILEAAGVPGFAGYLILMVQKFAVEFIFILLGGVAASAIVWREVYKVPLCATCGDWYGKEEKIGALRSEDYEKYFEELGHGNYYAMGCLLVEEIKEYPKFHLYQSKCSKCAIANVFLNLEELDTGSNGLVTRQILRLQVPYAAYSSLISGYQAAQRERTERQPAAG